VFLILGHYQASLVVSTAAASVMVGIAGAALGRWRKTHAFLYVVPGVMPLVPGLTIYQGMLDLFTSTGNAFEMLLRAVAVGLTIAAGVTLGEMIVRPVRRRRQTTDQQIVDQETRTDPRLTDTGSMPVID
jgi:uncharacterized membrane protein YjjB (DUF3815 family)